MLFDLAEICRMLQVSVPPSHAVADSLKFDGVSTLELAGETQLCFAERTEQAQAVRGSRAGAVIVPEDFPELEGCCLIRVPNARQGFFRVAAHFSPASGISGIHASAVVDDGAGLGADVAVGACAVISAGVTLGDRCVVGPGCYLGPGVVLGADCLLEANVSILRESVLGARCIVHAGSVIGSDGFGFAWDGSGHRKIPQLGRVVIEDDVDIGCNCCVDRATLGETRIRRGTKIDNLVQVAHNTDIGEHVILVSQSGVAGSSSVGTGAVIAGQVAISDHVNVGAGARVGGQSGVTKDVPAGATVFGTPARAMRDTLRELAALAQLPTLLKDVKRQSREIEALRERLARLEGPES
ncbi:MAG: UDP-3-O-(3-hydroxymyristoyl)glucosamine N-acyltransferase [Thiohalocapsa sp.]|nr:UDP-3-O-(3-hydroxymyristoyl)glucosamine N-acyltransferase [Thiohalocapsa sp.]